MINLSGGIPTWFVDQFSDTLYHVCQQKDSKFGQAVRVVSVLNAEDKSFDMLDEFNLTEKAERNAPTPVIDASTQRRWVATTPYHQSVLYDKDDDLSMLINPTSDYVTAFRRGVRRKKDDIILTAFEAAVTSGRRAGGSITWAAQGGNTKYTGKDTGRTIPHDCSVGNCSSSDTGMTVEKAQLIHEYFAYNDVDENIHIWSAISPRQFTDLLGQEEYINADYATSKPMATGRVVRDYLSMNWIISNKIVVGSNNDVDGDADVLECWAWAQDGMILGVADEVSIKITEESMLSYSQRVYVHMNMGCMRMDEDKILKVECQA